MSNNEDKIVEPNRRNIVSDDLVDCWFVIMVMVFNGFFSCNLKITVTRVYCVVLMVALLYFHTFKIRTSLDVKYAIYSCTLEPHSTDSLGDQHRAKKLSPEIALHLK